MPSQYFAYTPSYQNLISLLCRYARDPTARMISCARIECRKVGRYCSNARPQAGRQATYPSVPAPPACPHALHRCPSLAPLSYPQPVTSLNDPIILTCSRYFIARWSFDHARSLPSTVTSYVRWPFPPNDLKSTRIGNVRTVIQGARTPKVLLFPHTRAFI